MLNKKTITRIILLIMTCALLLTGGCAKSEDPAPDNTPSPSQQASTDSSPSPSDSTPPTPDEPADKPTDEPPEPAGSGQASERIGFITQSYDDGNIVEIPYIEYDGEMNPEIDAINRLYNQGYQFSYEDFMENKLDHEWIDIRSYPFTTDKYLQIVTTSCVYPNYGTDGDIASVNYDRNAKKWLTIEDALAMMGLSEDDVLYGAMDSFVPDSPDMGLADVVLSGFLIQDTPSGERVQYLLILTTENPEGESLQVFYSYAPDGNDLTNDLTQLGSNCLFDPYDMDQMDPPLMYQQNN